MKPAWIILPLAAIPLSWGDIFVSVDKLDSFDGIPLPPANLIAIDVRVDVTDGDRWLAAGIVATPANGAVLHYDHDPNGDPLMTAPGLDHRFTTFVGRPRGRNDDDRFLPDSAAYIAGRFHGGPPGPGFEPDQLDVAFTEPPPPPPPLGSGYIARLMLDLSAVNDPMFRVDSPNIVLALSPPPGGVPLLEAIRAQNGATNVVTFDNDSVWLDWGVYAIPEPSAMCLVIGAMALVRRTGRQAVR